MFTWYITLYTILVQKWGVGAYMVMGAYKVLYSTYMCIHYFCKSLLSFVAFLLCGEIFNRAGVGTSGVG